MIDEKAKYTAIHIANYFLRKQFGQNALKLQSLVYYAHGWHLHFYNQALINEYIQAWQFGPVIPSLYHALVKYGNDGIYELIYDYDVHSDAFYVPRINDFDDEVKSLLDAVWEQYGIFTWSRLRNALHMDNTPWAKHVNRFKRDESISNESILQYFRNIVAKNKSDERESDKYGEQKFGSYTIETVGNHCIIRREDGQRAEPTFYEMQHIKCLAFGGSQTAIEIFPASAQLVDGQNQRHLWAVDSNIIPNLKTGKFVDERKPNE